MSEQLAYFFELLELSELGLEFINLSLKSLVAPRSGAPQLVTELDFGT